MQKLAHTEVYSSLYAGSGKSYQISRACAAKGLAPVHFPLAGSLSFERICERLNVLSFTGAALVLQLYHVTDTRLLDEILVKIVVFRTLISSNDVFVLDGSVPIFIELENIGGINYESELLTIRMLALCTRRLKEAKSKHFVSPMNNMKVQFALAYMKLLRNSVTLYTEELGLDDFEKEFAANPTALCVSDGLARELV